MEEEGGSCSVLLVFLSMVCLSFEFLLCVAASLECSPPVYVFCVPASIARN